MARQFDRFARLVVVREGITTNILRHRVQFRVDKFAGGENNAAMIRVFNLSEEKRNQLTRRIPNPATLIVEPRTTVFLYAGYGGDDVPLISSGVVLNAFNSRRSKDWVTEIQTNSTIEQDVNAKLDKSYKNTPALTILVELFDKGNYPIPVLSKEAKRRLQEVLPDHIVSGQVKKSIVSLLSKFKLTFNIDHEGSIVLVSGDSVDADVPQNVLPLISQKSGMIGAPTVTKTGIVVRTLLDHRILPYKSFVVQAQTVTETIGVFSQRYTATQVQHIGDTRGDDWFTEIVGSYPNFVREKIEVNLRPREPIQ